MPRQRGKGDGRPRGPPGRGAQAPARDPALSPIEDVSPSLELMEQESMDRLQVGSMSYYTQGTANFLKKHTLNLALL